MKNIGYTACRHIFWSVRIGMDSKSILTMRMFSTLLRKVVHYEISDTKFKKYLFDYQLIFGKCMVRIR